MSSPPTDQEVIAHICLMLVMDNQAAAFLEVNQIRSVRRLTTTNVDIYQELTNKLNLPINSTDIGQVKLFKTWYTNQIQQNGPPTNANLINMLTEKVWDDFCQEHLIHVHNQQTPSTPSGGTQAPQMYQPLPSLKVSLRDYPITTGKASD